MRAETGTSPLLPTTMSQQGRTSLHLAEPLSPSAVKASAFVSFPQHSMKPSSPFTSPAYNLLPARIMATIPALGATSDNPDPTLHLKWFTPDANFTWFLAEYSPEEEIGYGFVIGPFPEWGTFSLKEIRQLRGSLGLPVERDLHFDPCPSSKITADF